jgi:peptide deformylase
MPTQSDEIYRIEIPEEAKLLRMKMPKFDFSKHDAKEIRALVARMKRAMLAARGIGLSANQIGLKLRMFVGQVPDANGSLKFYAVFNPEIQKVGTEKSAFEEGCLSIPGVYGETMRPDEVVLTGFDKNGKPLKIKAWGLLAKMFQHEVDHLNGIVFADHATDLHHVDLEGRVHAVDRWNAKH